MHGDTRRAGRESAGTALLDWSIALLWPALAPCPAIFPASVTTTQFIGPDPNPPAGRSRPAAARTSAALCRSCGNNPPADRKSDVSGKSVQVSVALGGCGIIQKKKKKKKKN